MVGMSKLCEDCNKPIYKVAEKLGKNWYHGRCWHRALSKKVRLQPIYMIHKVSD